MALASMTGFGLGRACGHGVVVEVELSSVNRRQLELRVSLPRGMEGCEAFVHRAIAGRISRGAVTAQIKALRPPSRSASGVRTNVDLARSVVLGMKRIAGALGLPEQISLLEIVRFPGVIAAADPAADAALCRRLLGVALNRAIAGLIETRKKEGRRLGDELSRRARRLGAILGRMRRRAPEVPGRHAAMLRRRLKAAGWTAEANDPGLRRELALFAERCDISEEMARMASHLERFFDELKSRRPAGRALDFLCQELLREATTAGSKANDSVIAGLVIEFKSVLEEMREQVQNVE